MIVKSGGGYKVKSEGGKNLSKGGLSLGQAKKRLAQVEYFKHKGGTHAFARDPWRGTMDRCLICGRMKHEHELQ